MASPTTAILDDFNRADEAPLSQAGAWTGFAPNGPNNQARLATNAAACTAVPSSSSRQRVAAFTNNMEAYVTVNLAVGATFADAGVIVRAGPGPNGGYKGYIARIYANYPQSGNSLAARQVGRRFAHSVTFMSFTQTQPSTVVGRWWQTPIDYASGDRLWVKCSGTVTTVYTDHVADGLGFMPRIEVDDNTFPTGTLLGLYIGPIGAARLDDFGGGSI